MQETQKISEAFYTKTQRLHSDSHLQFNQINGVMRVLG